MRRLFLGIMTLLCVAHVGAQTISTKEHHQTILSGDDPSSIVIIIVTDDDTPYEILQKRIATRQQLTDVPTVYINTDDNEGLSLVTDRKTAKIQVVDGQAHLTAFSQEGITITGWGTESWSLTEKPSFRITLATAQNMVNMDAATAQNTWLLKANAGDKSLVRNALAYDLSQAVGLLYAPRYRYVDLVLNETLMGTYQITDDVDVAASRVNITAATGWLLDMTTADGVNGNDSYITPDGGAPVVRMVNPEGLVKLATKSSISEFVAKMWQASDIRPYIDVPSFINWYIASEILGSYDAFSHVFVYKENGDDKLEFGPLADAQLSCDNSFSQSMTADGLMADTYISNSADGMICFSAMGTAWKAKMADVVSQPWFVSALKERWAQLMEQKLLQRLTSYIDDLALTLQNTQTLNFKSVQDGGAGWDIGDNAVTSVTRDGHFMFLSHNGAVGQVKTYLSERFDYLSVKIPAMKANYLLGDVNGDMLVDVNDVMALVSYICSEVPSPFYVEAADPNADGFIDVADVMWVVNRIISGVR